MQKNAPSTVGNKDARTLISDYGSRLNKIEQNQKASATAVSKTYTTAADYKAKAGSGVTKKPTGATTAADVKASGKGIENTYGNETLPKVQKETPVYTPSLAQKARTNIGNNIANRTTSAKTAPEYDIFLTPAQKAKNAVGQGVANRYNEGEKWLTTDDGTDYFAKGFVNRLRSTGGKAVEDLAYFIKDAGNNSVANSYSPGEEITLENREAARLNAMKNNTDWLRQNAEKVVEENRAGEIGDIASQQMAKAQENADTWLGKQLVMAGDSTATMLGYMLLPGGKTHLAAYMGAGGGLNEYREQRENGASEEEAQVRGITSGAISYLVESMGGIGAGVGQKIPGIGTIGKKLDELATKNFLTSVLSNAMDEGGEELVEYVADYVANCIADKMFKGEIQTEFDISEMFQNALTGAIVGGGFGAVKASPEIASTAKDIVEAVKNGKAIENVQAQQEAPAEEVLEQAANIPTEAQTEQEAAFASPTEKTFEQRAEELYRQGNSWGEIGKILQAEYHPDWNVDNVKKEARNYIRKSDFYGEKGTATNKEQTTSDNKKIAHPNLEGMRQEIFKGKNYTLEELEALPEVQEARKRANLDSKETSYDKFFDKTTGDYTPERKIEHNRIINDLMSRGSALFDENGKPVVDEKGNVQYNGVVEQGRHADIVIGPPAAGKSTVFADPLSYQHKARIIDSDDIKRMLPEFDNGYGSNFIHDESAKLAAGSYTDLALENGENVIFPLVGGKTKKIRDLIGKLRNNGYTVNLYYNEVPAEVATNRAFARFVQNGRFIPLDYVAGIYSDPEQNPTVTYYELLKEGVADYYEHKDNNVGYGERPRLVENPTGRDLYRPGLSPEVRYEQSIRQDGRNRRDVLSDAKRSLPGTETGTEVTNEAGAESPGFSDGQNSLDYSALQNITNTLYGKPDAENKDIYAPFYPKDNRPEGNTVGAKQSTTPFWAAGGQYGTYEPKARQTYEGNELFEAPKRLSNDGKQEVSEAVQSVAASPIGTTETLDYMIQNIDKFTHAVDTDVESVTKAKDYLETNGLENSVKYWKKIVDGKSKYTKDDGVLAATTIRLLQEQGRQTEANEMTAELVAEISTAAQATQGAEAIYKILDPANMNIATNSEYYIKHLTEKLNEKHKGQLKGKEIKADQKLLEEALAANGTEKQGEAWDKVYANIANQVPATFWEKLNNIRYFCMLSNPRTHIRNTVSNLAMYGISGVKDGIKSVVEAAYNNTKAVKSGKAEESRTASVKRAPKEYREFAKEDFKAVRNVNETGKYSEQTGSFVSANRTKINDNILLGAIKARFKGDSKTEAVINKILDQGVFNSLAEFNSYMLGEVEDGGAKSMIYTRAMSQYMQANNLTPEFLKSDVGAADLQKARAYASAEALYNTFNEANGLSDAINKLENKNILTKIFLGSTLPFKKVPLNLVKTGFDYSPAGLITSSYKMIKALQGAEVKGAKVDANAAIDGVAKGITGTGVVLIGAVLRSLGYLTNGLSDDDKEANFEKLQGKQAFAIRLPNGDTYSLDFLQPAGMMLFSGAAIHDVVSDLLNKKGGEILEKDESGNIDINKSLSNFADIGINTIASFYEPMIEMSMLQNVKEILIDGNKTTVPQFIVDIIGDYANQFVPQFLSALSKTLDDTQRNPYYVDKTNNMPDMFEKHINVAMSKIPGLSQTLPEKIDNWGRTQKNNPNVALRAFENFISPGIYKESKTTEVDKYLNQLYVKTGEKSILPSNMAKNFSVDGEKTNLSAKQYAEAQKVKGQTAYNLVEDVMSNSVFKGLSAEEQASVISSIYQYSTAIAKSKVSDYEPTDWIAKASEAEKQGLEIDDYITLHKIKSNLEKTDEKSVSEQFLDQLYVTKISDEAKVAALEYIGGVNVDKYRSAVSDPKDMLALYDITSFDDAKEGQVEKDVDIEQIKKQFGVDWYKAHEVYNKAKDNWSYNIEDVIDASTNPTSREATVKNLTRWGFTDSEIIGGYNAIIGYGNAKKDVQLELLTNYFGSKKKAEKFYGVKEGLKDYR